MDKLHYHTREAKSPIYIQATGCSACVLIALALAGIVAIINFVLALV